MAKTSEEFINSSSSLVFVDCLKENCVTYIFFYFTRLVCTILGSAAHLWCLRFYFCGNESKFRPTHVFSLNHSIMELMYCLNCVPEMVNMFVFHNVLCSRMLFFWFGLAWTGRPLLQTCICIEQYLAVLHPVTFLRYKDIKYRIAVVAASWIIAFGYGLNTIRLNSFPDPIFNFVFFTTVTVISFCCVSVLYALKQSRKRISNQTGRYVGNQKTRNVFNMIFSALLVILLTYFPQVLYSLFTIVDMEQKLLQCNIVPFLCFLNAFGIIITPLQKMYKEGHIKLNNRRCGTHEPSTKPVGKIPSREYDE